MDCTCGHDKSLHTGPVRRPCAYTTAEYYCDCAKYKAATTPVAKKPKACAHVGAHYQGDIRDEDGKRWQLYTCAACASEFTQEAEDA